MRKTIFRISKMDCPSEENLIRMKLDSLEAIQSLEFDIPNRKLAIFHFEKLDEITSELEKLNLGSQFLSTHYIEDNAIAGDSIQKRLLWTVLLINLGFFTVEMVTGLISMSMGLVADSLDMLADSIVYGLSLFAVGGTVVLKKRIAKASGYFQITLAVLGFAEIIRRFIGFEDVPDFRVMIIVSLLALLGNSICLYLLQRSKSDEAHMKASMIFTSNDVIINLGVIVAALLVNWLDSNKPDLIIGAMVFVLVMQGAFRILKLGK